MGKVDDKPSTAWQSADDALASCFNSDEKFDELPVAVQARFSRGLMPRLWDQSTPLQRRIMARQWDHQQHPALAHAHEAVWERMELNDCGAEPLGPKKDLAAAELVLQQAANRIGLGFTPASRPQLVESVRAVYAHASRHKMLAPNINMLVPIVKEVLHYTGHSASAGPIKAVGNLKQFQKCRLGQGVRNNGSFAPFSLQNWSKSGR